MPRRASQTVRVTKAVRRFLVTAPDDIGVQVAIHAAKRAISMNSLIVQAIEEFLVAHNDDPEYVPPPKTDFFGSNNSDPLDKDIALMTESELRAKAAQMLMTYEEICKMRDEDKEEQL